MDLLRLATPVFAPLKNHFRKISLFSNGAVNLPSVVAVMVALVGSGLKAEVTDRHREVAQTTFDRLVDQIEPPEDWDVWPPRLLVVDNDEVQALAYPRQTEEGLVPTVEVYSGLIERVANFEADVLAFVVGHEIGHLVYHHGRRGAERAEKYGPVKVSTAVTAAGRDQELEADYFGMKLALKAGFSHRGIRQALKGMAKTQGENYYCSFEGLMTSHPSWDLRASYLQQDEVQRELWRSMVAFRNGVLFLETENYIHAEFCFRKVTDEFPDCYEGWANLGYALLMQYADALDEEDLRRFDVGHIVVGGFYRRPDSLSAQIRGIDEDLWFEAVGAFREALRVKERQNLDDDMIMVRANLAVAYLIHPAGKQVGEAEKHFTEVLKLLDQKDNADEIDPLLKATILVNAGAGRPLEDARIQEALSEIRQIAKRQPNAASEISTLTAALNYSQALRLSGSSQRSDRVTSYELLEKYLSTISPASSWWQVAYSEYEKIAAHLGETPKARSHFRQPSVQDWRPVTSITLPNGVVLGLSQLCDDVLPELGKPDITVPVIDSTNLKTHRYQELGITVLGSRDVLAVFLETPEAPPIQLTRPGIGGGRAELRVGMQRHELESLLGDEWQVEFASIDDPDTVYHLYRNVGVAVRFHGTVVDELAVVVVPRKE